MLGSDSSSITNRKQKLYYRFQIKISNISSIPCKASLCTEFGGATNCRHCGGHLLDNHLGKCVTNKTATLIISVQHSSAQGYQTLNTFWEQIVLQTWDSFIELKAKGLCVEWNWELLFVVSLSAPWLLLTFSLSKYLNSTTAINNIAVSSVSVATDVAFANIAWSLEVEESDWVERDWKFYIKWT